MEEGISLQVFLLRLDIFEDMASSVSDSNVFPLNNP